MNRASVEKIRDIVSHPDEETPSLQMILNHVAKMSGPATKLEIHNNKQALEELKKLSRELKTISAKLYLRLKEEVQPEVIQWLKEKPKGKPRGTDIQENISK